MNKPAIKSKINWLGGMVTVLGILLMPETQGYLKEFISPALLSKLVSGAGIATIVVRSFFTEVCSE